MAFCPQCTKEMGMTAVVCPHCGYDFPTQPCAVPERSGIAYSGLADVALIVGQFAAAFGAVIALVYVAVLLLSLHFLHAVIAAIGFLLSLASFVVFVRISDMNDNRT